MQAKPRQPVFSDADRALQRIQEEVSAVEYLHELYRKQEEQGKPPAEWGGRKGLRPTVGHIMFTGPAGCGKTTYANKVAEMMGLQEGVNYHKVSADSFPTIQDFILFLQEKLTWEGYLCNNGKIRGDNRRIIDPKTPRGPVPPVAIFFDEIHMLPKKIQDKFGVILLEFYYALKTESGFERIYFPRFTVMGATTDVGLLTPALQSRFKLHVPVNYYSVEEMEEIVRKMCKDRRLELTEEATKIVARCAQGVPRSAENHLDQLLSHWIFKVTKLGYDHSKPLCEKFVSRFYDHAKYIKEGYTFDQIELLKYLANGNIDKKGKRLGMGIVKICHRFGIDKLNYLHNWEPILQRQGLICTGTRGREITKLGLSLLRNLSERYPNKNWSVH